MLTSRRKWKAFWSIVVYLLLHKHFLTLRIKAYFLEICSFWFYLTKEFSREQLLIFLKLRRRNPTSLVHLLHHLPKCFVTEIQAFGYTWAVRHYLCTSIPRGYLSIYFLNNSLFVDITDRDNIRLFIVAENKFWRNRLFIKIDMRYWS